TSHSEAAAPTPAPPPPTSVRIIQVSGVDDLGFSLEAMGVPTGDAFTMAEEAIAALASLRAQVSVAESPEITARYPAHFGARVNGFETVDTLGDPERPVSEDHIIEKVQTLARWGGLAESDAERAIDLALHSDDAGAIDIMLEHWLA
ncbi:MAG: hypothetical protein AAGE86_14140, partial [Pseudomonadota bacterium]